MNHMTAHYLKKLDFPSLRNCKEGRLEFDSKMSPLSSLGSLVKPLEGRVS